jgi:hypothetical protein
MVKALPPIMSFLHPPVRLASLLLSAGLGIHPVHASLIGHWTLDETSGPWADSAGPVFTPGSNSGGVTPGVTTVPAGLYGAITVTPDQSAALGNAINVPFNASVFLGSAVGSDLNRVGDFTLMAWVQPTQTTGSHMVFATGAGGENGWKFGHINTQLRLTANGVIDVTVPSGNFTLTPNVWQHWAVAVTGVAGSRGVEFFVNGQSVHSTTVSNILLSTSPNMMIGNNGEQDPGTAGGTSFNENFNGRLDEIRYFNRALSATEIVQSIPEPGTAGLLLCGLLGLARRRAGPSAG